MKLTVKERERLWSKIRWEGGCWVWTNANLQFRIHRAGKRLSLNPRKFLWEQKHKRPLKGRTERVCQNANCVSPGHAVERETEKWLLSTVTLDPDAGCWLWPANDLDACGYGNPKTFRGVNIAPHRIAHALFLGADLSGGERTPVCHQDGCPKRCVNPWHSKLGTRKLNTEDTIRAGNHSRQKLSHDDVGEILSRLKEGERRVSIAKRYGLNPRTVSSIKYGRIWINHPERPPEWEQGRFKTPIKYERAKLVRKIQRTINSLAELERQLARYDARVN